MALAADAHEHRTMFDRIGEWWRHWRERNGVLAALDQCGRTEVERMARDVGLGGNDLRVLAGKWPDGATLLERRIEMLGVDRASAGLGEPQVMRDLLAGVLERFEFVEVIELEKKIGGHVPSPNFFRR